MSRPSLRIVLVSLALFVLFGAAACTRDVANEVDPTPIPTATPTPDPSAPSATPTPPPTSTPNPDGVSPDPEAAAELEEDEPTDRIAVRTIDSQLFTILSDGTDRLELTDDDGSFNAQPTWSPDGNRIAWSTFDPATGASAIRVDHFDRSDLIERPTQSPPFYLNWDRSSSQIGFLAPSPGGIDFGYAELTEDTEAIRLDRGEPFWFSWGPLGDELLVHVSDFRLDRIDIKDGTVRIIAEEPAPFQAPIWIDDQNSLLFADISEGQQELVISGPLGENRRPLARYDGYLQMTVSPGEGRIAFQALPQLPPPGVITASTDVTDTGALVQVSASSAVSAGSASSRIQEIPTPDPNDPFADPVDDILSNTLNVMGVYGGDAYVVSFDPAVAFFWSRDGETLAYLNNGFVPNSLRWTFFRAATGEIIDGPSFIPSDVFRNEYLPFFDQYEQSVEFFSPDSDRIVYAGTDMNGQSGIFTVGLEPNSQPELISEGVFATWSPDAASGGAASVL